jgi:Trp operon repressor
MRAALTNQNAASGYNRTSLLLNAETLGMAVTTVTRGANTLFMCEQLEIDQKHFIHLRLS